MLSSRAVVKVTWFIKFLSVSYVCVSERERESERERVNKC